MFNTTSFEDLFATELDQENMGDQIAEENKVYGEDVVFEFDDSMDETLPAEEMELLNLEYQWARIEEVEASHNRLLATVTTSIENGGARGDSVTAITGWYEDASAFLGAHAAEGIDAESFAEVGGALSATQEVELKVKENIGKLKAGAANVIKKIIQTLKNLFKRYLTKAGRVKAKVQSTFGAAATVKGKAKNSKVSFKGIGYASTADNSKKAAEFVMGVSKSGLGQTASGVKQLIEAATGDSVDTNAITTAMGAIRTGIEKDLGRVQKVDGGHELVKKSGLKGEGNFYIAGYEMGGLGGKALVIFVPTAADSTKAPSVRTVAAGSNPSELPHVEPATLGPGAKALIENAMLVGQKLDTVIGGLESAAKGNIAGDRTKQVKNAISFLGELGKQVHLQAVLQAEAQANYAMACVKNMGKGDAPKKDEGKSDEGKGDEGAGDEGKKEEE
ncbi:hypothetical protein SM033_00243 [Vibrio phage vB_VpaM_sm033]|nr:hypothetical protein SM033_00243 [Vibrio phage vB_VpaM_sm033]